MSEVKKKEKGEKGDKGEKKEKPLMLIVIIMLVLLIALVAFLAYSTLTKDSTKTTATTTTTTPAVAVKEIPEFTYSFEKEFLVNLSDTDSKRYLKATISLGYTSKKLTAELEEVTTVTIVRDSINSVLRSKKAADFTDHGTEDLKKEIITRINPLLKKGKVSEIYFNDILVQ